MKKRELEFSDVLNIFRGKYKLIFMSTALGAFLGLFLGFILPKSYRVSTVLLPQNESDNGLGKISSLAAMAGFDLNMGATSTEISPIIFPQVIESTSFLEELMMSEFDFEGIDKPMSLFDYFIKIKKPIFYDYIYGYTIGLPNTLKALMKSDQYYVSSTKRDSADYFYYSRSQMDIIQYLNTCLTLTINKKEGYLTLTCVLPEPVLSAQVAEKAVEILQRTIIQFKTSNAQEQLRFIEARYNEKKLDYENAQMVLASFIDRNHNMQSAFYLNEQQRLQNNYDIEFSVYSELSRMLEQSRIQVKRQTPVFLVIKPIVVPVDKFKPQRGKLLVIGLFLDRKSTRLNSSHL